jgi:hypothetical protein
MKFKIVLLILLCTLIGGCASAGYQGMTPEQIAATAKMKDANVNCVVLNSPYGRGVTVFINLDKGVIPLGTITVDSECKTTVSTSPAPFKPEPTLPAPTR